MKYKKFALIGYDGMGSLMGASCPVFMGYWFLGLWNHIIMPYAGRKIDLIKFKWELDVLI